VQVGTVGGKGDSGIERAGNGARKPAPLAACTLPHPSTACAPDAQRDGPRLLVQAAVVELQRVVVKVDRVDELGVAAVVLLHGREDIIMILMIRNLE
jgi:hypothetical protein